MQTVHAGVFLGQSSVIFLPMINLTPSDKKCIYSTQLFICGEVKDMHTLHSAVHLWGSKALQQNSSCIIWSSPYLEGTQHHHEWTRVKWPALHCSSVWPIPLENKLSGLHRPPYGRHRSSWSHLCGLCPNALNDMLQGKVVTWFEVLVS